MKLGTLAALCACLLFIGCDPVEDSDVVPAGGNAGEGGAAGAGGGEAGAAGAGGGEAGTAGTGGGEAGTAGAGGGEAGTAGAGGGEAGTAGAGGGEAGIAGAGGGEAGSGGMVPCKDVDRDGECDDVDSLCNADGIPLACRRATPDCPPNTVPETRNGCFTDRCVTWDECGELVPSDTPCGGIAGIQCPDGFFCNYPIEAMCGSGDMQGVCTPFEPDGPCTRELFFGSVVVTEKPTEMSVKRFGRERQLHLLGNVTQSLFHVAPVGRRHVRMGNTATTLSMQVADEPIDQVSARHSTRKCRVPESIFQSVAVMARHIRIRAMPKPQVCPLTLKDHALQKVSLVH